MRIHKYHIADILTLCEVICTCILGVILVTGAKPQTALIIFGIGELCDAFDGICARKLGSYPNDGKYRWWREYAPAIDQITDVFHLSIMALFFIFRICARFTHFRPWIAFSVALAVTLVCVIVQVIITDPKHKGTLFALCLVLARRILYLVCIAIIVFVGLFATTWPLTVKTAITAILCIGAIILLIIKWDRLPINEIINSIKKSKRVAD